MRLFFLALAFSVACNSKDGDTGSDVDDDSSPSDEAGGDGGDGDDGDDGDDDDADGDDDGGDSQPTGMETGRFLGTMAADWSADAAPSDELPEGISITASCGGAVSLEMDDAMAFSGAAGCSEDGSSTPVLGFDINGTQTDLELSGTLELDFYGDILETDFTGTRDGDEMVLTFAQTHEDGGNSFDISGTITANLVE